MKLLLVGFSKQNASVIKIFCNNNFEQFECETVRRQLTDNLHLRLPTLTFTEQTSDAFIIYLDGVGMTTFKSEYQKPLLDFLGDKPCILISRRDLDKWKSSDFLLPNRTLYLKYPYTTDTVHTQLETLLKILTNTSTPTEIQQVSNHTQQGLNANNLNKSIDNTSAAATSSSTSINEDTINKNNIDSVSSPSNESQTPSALVEDTQSDIETEQSTTQKADNLKTKSGFEAIYEAACQHPKFNKVDKAIKLYYPSLFDISFTKNALVMMAQTDPMKLTVGAHFLLIDPLDHKVVLNEDVTRVVDYLSIAGRYLPTSATRLNIKLISTTEFNGMSKKLLEDGEYKNYSLNTLLWEVAESVISQDLEYHEHTMKMKIYFMPNLNVIPNVPNYVYPVLSACLLKPRSLNDLNELFPELGSKTLNRLMAIAMLSGILDSDHLFDDSQSINPTEENTELPEVNKSIQKARKSGFFQRLLDKLAI